MPDAEEPEQRHRVEQEKEIRVIDREVNELAGLLAEVRHQRPLIERMDMLEDERQSLMVQLERLEAVDRPEIQSGRTEKRKTDFRQFIWRPVFDGEELEVTLNLATLIRVKVASPGGFEPPLPP